MKSLVSEPKVSVPLIQHTVKFNESHIVATYSFETHFNIFLPSPAHSFE